MPSHRNEKTNSNCSFADDVDVWLADPVARPLLTPYKTNADTPQYQDAAIRALLETVARCWLEHDGYAYGGGHVGNGRVASTTKAGPKANRGGKRVRRSAEELAKHAKAISEFVAAAGDEGRSGSEIRAKYHVGEGTTIKAFVEQYAGTTLKTKGKKAGMRYFAK